MARSETAIAIIGTGRVGQALGRLLRERGEDVVAVSGRSPELVAAAAAFVGPDVECVPLDCLPSLARKIIIAVADEAIGEVAARLATAGMREGIAVHTCGAAGPELLAPLARAGVHCGVVHPLQTIANPAQGLAALPGSSFLVDGDEAARRWGAEIVARLGGRLLEIPSDRRALYHAAAVLASNYLVALLSAASAALSMAGVREEEALQALAPLAQSSVSNALALGPIHALTGPIRRGDIATVAAHLEAMRTLPPALDKVYRALGLQALALAREAGLPADRARPLEMLLREQPSEGVLSNGNSETDSRA